MPEYFAAKALLFLLAVFVGFLVWRLRRILPPQVRTIERVIPADPEGCYLGLPGEMFQPIPERRIRVSQYLDRGEWKDFPSQTKKNPLTRSTLPSCGRVG